MFRRNRFSHRGSASRKCYSKKQVRKLRIEQESYLVRLCEVMEQKNKAVNDKDMNGEDKRLLTTRLE